MGFFGKSEAELKQIATDLDKQQTELGNRESALASTQSNVQHEKALIDEARAQFNGEREAFREAAKKEREDIAAENAALEKRRFEIAKLEAEAKTGFVESQREAFKEVVEKRLAELDARQQELDGLEKRLSVKLKDLHTAEGEMARRELAVTEREQKADAGFADKAKALAEEAARQHQANQAEAERLRKQADAISEERQRLEDAKANLAHREQAIIVAEQKRDAGFADERAALNSEIRNRLAEMEAEIAESREKALSALEDEIANRKGNGWRRSLRRNGLSANVSKLRSLMKGRRGANSRKLHANNWRAN